MTGGISSRATRTLLACIALLGLTWATALDARATPTWLAPQTVSAPTAAPVGIEPALAMGANGTLAGAWWSEGGRIVADVRPAGTGSFTQEAVSPAANKASLPSAAAALAVTARDRRWGRPADRGAHRAPVSGDSVLECVADRLRAVADAGLGEDAVHVGLDGRGRDHQGGGDLRV